MDSAATTRGTITDPNVAKSFDILWLILHAYLAFFFQCGFALIEAGNVRVASAKQVPFKTLLLACFTGLVWFVWGHAIAYGEKEEGSGNVFMGGKDFALSDPHAGAPVTESDTSYAFWLLQWGLACAAAAIMSGALAERCRLASYLISSLVLVGLVYPAVVHWVWSSDGWLSAGRNAGGPLLGGNGLIDEAGSGVIHITAGCAALMGAYFIGPRKGRFHTDGTVLPVQGSSMVLSSLGTMFVWFAWFGLAAGNSWLMKASIFKGSKVAVSTALAACAAGMSSLGITLARRTHVELLVMLDGIRAGLVAISAAAAVVEPYAAVIIGLVAGGVYLGGAAAVVQVQVDDPTSSVAVHLLPGVWGLVAAGLFATKNNLQSAGYLNPPDSYGVFYGGDGKQLGIQLLGAASIMLWATSVSAVMFFLLRHAKLLRLHVSEELTGMQWGASNTDWRYNGEEHEEDGGYEGQHCKGEGSIVGRSTFLADEDGYYNGDDGDEGAEDTSIYFHHGPAGKAGGAGGAVGATREAMRRAPSMGAAGGGGGSSGSPMHSGELVSHISSTATSDTSQQQPSRLGSNMSLGQRQGSRLVVQVDARSPSLK